MLWNSTRITALWIFLPLKKKQKEHLSPVKWTVLICVEWNQSVCTALWIMEGYISDLSLTESDALNIWEQNKCFPVKHFYFFAFFLLCINPCLHACQSVLIVPLQSWIFSWVGCCFSFPSALSALHLFICVSLASCQRLKVGSINSHVCVCGWGGQHHKDSAVCFAFSPDSHPEDLF